MNRCVMAGLGAVLTAALASGCSSEDKADGGAFLACRHFRNVASDYSAGVLTFAELRDKLKEVDDDAQVSEEPGVAAESRALLAAATAGDQGEMAVHVAALEAACTRAGF